MYIQSVDDWKLKKHSLPAITRPPQNLWSHEPESCATSSVFYVFLLEEFCSPRPNGVGGGGGDWRLRNKVMWFNSFWGQLINWESNMANVCVCGVGAGRSGVSNLDEWRRGEFVCLEL